jgi:hypothetical protein
MKYAAARTLPFQGRPKDVDEWGTAHPSHETPSLLFFAKREERAARELSELLTKKFREYFP